MKDLTSLGLCLLIQGLWVFLQSDWYIINVKFNEMSISNTETCFYYQFKVYMILLSQPSSK